MQGCYIKFNCYNQHYLHFMNVYAQISSSYLLYLCFNLSYLLSSWQNTNTQCIQECIHQNTCYQSTILSNNPKVKSCKTDSLKLKENSSTLTSNIHRLPLRHLWQIQLQLLKYCAKPSSGNSLGNAFPYWPHLVFTSLPMPVQDLPNWNQSCKNLVNECRGAISRGFCT